MRVSAFLISDHLIIDSRDSMLSQMITRVVQKKLFFIFFKFHPLTVCLLVRKKKKQKVYLFMLSLHVILIYELNMYSQLCIILNRLNQ